MGELMQVKLFDEEHELDLEADINQFLKSHPQVQVNAIHFSTCCAMQGEEQIFCFSAMIIYENKKEDLYHPSTVEVKM